MGRGSGMANVVPDEQVLSGDEVEAMDIQQRPAGYRSQPDRMRWIEASEAKHGRCIGLGDNTNVSVRCCDRQGVPWIVRETRNPRMPAHMEPDHAQSRG
jgi:hypothetical protein